MLKSTKIALISLVTWVVLNVVKGMYAPKIDPLDESSVVVMSGPVFALWSVAQFLTNILVFVFLIALLITALTKLKLIPRDY